MSILQNSNAISAGGYDINNSLRFRSSASAYLSRTPASNGNRRTWTWSAWVKRGSLGSYQVLFGAGLNNGVNADELVSIYFTNSDQLGHYVNETGVADRNNYSTAVYRDPSAWYHIVAIYDSTQATAANRQRLFVNNVEITSWAATSYVSQNYQPSVNSTAYPHAIGKYGFNNTRYFDGYMTEVNFIDGQALTPSSFGETDTTTGSWKPKAYTGTYGTNGFYLKFSDIATTSGSNAGLGKDFSGNGNYWTTNNISVTSGTTYDAMTDSPTLTSATVGNYAVLNPLWKGSVLTLAGANLNVTSSGLTGSALSTIAMESGKYYCEVRLNSSTDATIIGIAISSFNPTTSNLSGAGGVGYYVSNGDKFVNGTQTAYGASCASGDIVGIAVDITAGTITFYKNNVSQGAITHGLTGPFYFATSDVSSSSNIDQSWNFGQRPFSYTPPTGYVALNTYNLPDSTIKKGNKYMDATTYSGNSSSQSIVNAGAFKPDMIWFKNRNNTENNAVFDTLRPLTTALRTNSTIAEYTNTDTDDFVSYNSNGFSLNGNGGTLNFSSYTYVAWQWQAGQGTTSSNTSGSITSTVSVNTTAGFSIVTYTGVGSVRTVGHGLGVAPKFIIAKTRNNIDNWPVGTSALGWDRHLLLNLSSAVAVTSSTWSDTAPTSSVFTVGTDNRINGSGWTYVAYCFAEIAGFSKFGSYTGNGSADGSFVYTGFRPKFILIKCSSASATNWAMVDTSRNTYNVANLELDANDPSAEQTGSSTTMPNMDVLSNGFKMRTTSAGGNASGSTYIYAAFAENPFKNSLAR